MAQANDSISITPGVGASIATQLASDGKEYQVLVEAGPSGHIKGTSNGHTVFVPAAAATANRNYLSIFNAAGSGKQVKVRKMFIQLSGAAVTGVPQTWRLSKTSTVGSGGTAQTLRSHDSTNTAVPAQITASSGTSTLPTAAFTYWEMSINPEESTTLWTINSFYNILPTDGDYVTDYTLREGEGLMLQNITGLAYSYSVMAVVSIV